MAEEFLAVMLGTGAVIILSTVLKHWLRQREFQRRIESAMERYNLDWDN